MLSHISLVYYLKKPANSGGLRFIDADAPNQFAPYLFREEMLAQGVVKQPALFNTKMITLQPKEDDVWIFPSMTEHATEPNLSDEPRISIAVDIETWLGSKFKRLIDNGEEHVPMTDPVPAE